mgnify:CR=1 FL=1
MNRIRITKIFQFEAAHSLDHHEGLCANLHGHSYRLEICVIGGVQSGSHSESGMVMDFQALKQIVSEVILNHFDHALIVERQSPYKIQTTKRVEMDVQPTCENMLLFFAERLRNELPEHVELHHLKLHETATGYAEWYAEDNL